MRFFFCILFLSINLSALEIHDYAVKLSSRIDSSNGYKVIIEWDKDPKAISYNISIENENTFIELSTLSPESSSFLFDNGQEFYGSTKEVKVVKSFKVADSSENAFGYLDIGYNLPEKKYKGGVILLCDNIMYDSLFSEIQIYKEHLSLSGYYVDILEVRREERFNAKAIFQTKEMIKNHIKNSNPDINFRTLIIIGRVAVPFSGYMSPDGHADESLGAWPADSYYADLDGHWSDDDVNSVIDTLLLPWHNNSLYDGKFDNGLLPSDVDLELGRIDFFDLPDFEQSEVQLFKRYFRKNQDWRQGKIKYPRNAIIDDKFGFWSREVFAAEAWMNFSSLVGVEKIDSMQSRFILREKPYLFHFATAPGWYTSLGFTTDSEVLSDFEYKSVFAFLFGSRVLEWTFPDNLLRSTIASEPSYLTAAWTVRPYWYLHHMGTGNSIGYSAKISQNNFEKYESNGTTFYRRASYMTLMGDPTLEMTVTPPPEISEVIPKEASTAVVIKPNPGIEYYNFYELEGFSEFQNNELGILKDIKEPDLIDGAYIIPITPNKIVIKAVMLQETNSASYYQESIGVIIE